MESPSKSKDVLPVSWLDATWRKMGMLGKGTGKMWITVMAIH